MVSSTDGSPTITGWKRRSSAASFSTCLRYSSSVVAPTARSSPRASIGFSRLAASTAPSAAPGADDRVQLVDEEDHLARGVLDLLEHGLQPVLELAAVLGAGEQRARRRARPRACRARPSGMSPGDDPLGEALDDGGLADAGLADQHRVVLGAAREHLDDAADLLVAADDRVERRRARPASVRSRPYCSSAWYLSSGFGSVTRRRAAHRPQRAPAARRGSRRCAASASRAGDGLLRAGPSSRCSVEMYSSPSAFGLLAGAAQHARGGRCESCALAGRRAPAGSRSMAATVAARRPARSAPARSSTGSTTPSRASSSASSRCVGLDRPGCRAPRRARAGRRCASWARSVGLSTAIGRSSSSSSTLGSTTRRVARHQRGACRARRAPVCPRAGAAPPPARRRWSSDSARRAPARRSRARRSARSRRCSSSSTRSMPARLRPCLRELLDAPQPRDVGLASRRACCAPCAAGVISPRRS